MDEVPDAVGGVFVPVENVKVAPETESVETNPVAETTAVTVSPKPKVLLDAVTVKGLAVILALTVG